MAQVPAQRTPTDAQTLSEALAQAWQTDLGARPSRTQIAVLLAQSALETARWKSMFNWNFGNVKAGPNTPLWYGVRCSEIIDGREVFFDPPDPACRFVAYPSMTDGVRAYFTLLRRRFAAAWPYVEASDPDGFVRALKREHYFTADVDAYANAVRSLYREFLQVLPPDPLPPTRDVGPLEDLPPVAGRPFVPWFLVSALLTAALVRR